MLWILAVAPAGLYCIVRGVVDFRRRRFVWGSIGLLSGGLLLLTPIPSHVVKIDLPTAPQR